MKGREEGGGNRDHTINSFFIDHSLFSCFLICSSCLALFSLVLSCVVLWGVLSHTFCVDFASIKSRSQASHVASACLLLLLSSLVVSSSFFR